MRIAHCSNIRRELRDLSKNRPFIMPAVKQFERLLLANKVPLGDVYSGLHLLRGDKPAKIVKFKVFIPGAHGGKRSGLRYVCEFLEVNGEDWSICLSIHMHAVGQDRESIHRTTYRARAEIFDLNVIEQCEVTY